MSSDALFALGFLLVGIAGALIGFIVGSRYYDNR